MHGNLAVYDVPDFLHGSILLNLASEVAAPTTSSGEFRRGWPIVLSSCVGIALGISPIPFYEIGLFAPSLAAEFHWGMGAIMAGCLFMMGGCLAASPVAGFLADRFGTRRVVLASILGFGASLAMFALQTGSLPLYYANWFVMALAGAGTLPVTWTRSINQHFDRDKGLALGLALAGTGLSGLLIKPATGAIIAHFGWRAGFGFLAGLPLAIALPLAGFCLREPRESRESLKPRESRGSRSSGSLVQPAPVDSRRDTPLEGRSLRQAVRDWRFWVIGGAIVPVAFAIAGPIANLEAILRGQGVEHGFILRVAPLVGFAVIVARVTGGWLVDRVWAPAVGMGLFTLAAAASWAVVHLPPTPATVLFGVLGIGLAAGLEFDLMSFLTARYFGPKAYGGIYGTMYAFFGLGSGAAPLLYGRAFDATGSYTVIVSVGAVAMGAGGLLLLLLGPYRYVPARP